MINSDDNNINCNLLSNLIAKRRLFFGVSVVLCN